MILYPPKLRPGDQLRVIAPSRSLSIIAAELRQIAIEKLTGMGFYVTYGEHAEEDDLFHSSPVASRAADIHAAFADPQVKGILSAIGGYNANQLLSYLDYELIRANPKVLCGFSDITALTNAIYAQTGLVTYSGPHFSTFGMRLGCEYTHEYFARCLVEDQPYATLPSAAWSDDAWYRNQVEREFIPNPGPLAVNPGQAEGRILGGNLCTFNLLQGTPYMPDLQDSILFIEDDEESPPHTFDRDLQSLLHQPGFAGVRGVVIGRFQNASQMDETKLFALLRSKRELDNIPVIVNADFGHTTPQFTFPIGGRGRIEAGGQQAQITILEH